MQKREVTLSDDVLAFVDVVLRKLPIKVNVTLEATGRIRHAQIL